MAADTNVLSQSITNLDATPVIPNSAGQGAPWGQQGLGDWVLVTAAGIATLGSYYKICRFSTKLKIKSVQIFTDKALDSHNTATLALDFGICFSDSAVDGTLAKWQGQIPTTANNGAVTTFGTYAAPNLLFGTYAPTSFSAALAPTNITFNGSNANYPYHNLTEQPLWQLFGFTNGQGYPQDPGGYFDLYAYVSTAATTGVAGYLGAKIDYAL